MTANKIKIGIIGGSIKTGCLDAEIGNFNNGDSSLSACHSAKNKNFQKLIHKRGVIPPCFRCHALNFIW